MLTIEEESRRSMSPTRSQINWIVVVVVAAQVGYIQTTNQTIANFASDEDFFSFSFQPFGYGINIKEDNFIVCVLPFLGKIKEKEKIVFFYFLLWFSLFCYAMAYEASASW